MQTKKELVIDASVRGRNNNSPNRHYSQAKNANQKKASSENETSSLKIAFLGGLNEVGKNMTLYEYGGDMMLVDCGMAFPDQDMLGVDIVLPDFTFVERNADKIRGIIVYQPDKEYSLREIYYYSLPDPWHAREILPDRIIRSAQDDRVIIALRSHFQYCLPLRLLKYVYPLPDS